MYWKVYYENLFRAQSDNNVSDWLSEVRKVLISIGMNVWQQQTVENEKMFLFIAKQSLKDLAYQKKLTVVLTIQISVWSISTYPNRETYTSICVKVFLQNVERL